MDGWDGDEPRTGQTSIEAGTHAFEMIARAQAWLAQDPDGETRTELRAILEAAEGGDADATAVLDDRFGTRLAFGTAGLRGALGAGSNRMNRVLVAQAAAGLAAYLLEKAGDAGASDAPEDDADADEETPAGTGPEDVDYEDAEPPGAETGDHATEDAAPEDAGSTDDTAGEDWTPEDGAGPDASAAAVGAEAAPEPAHAAGEPAIAEGPLVVVGYDGRRNSDVFAKDSAELFAGAGLRAVLLPRLLPTPVLAFAVRHLGAAAGVMVTASHNPPDDNGYKVYLGGEDEGAQIVPPADAEIAAHIQRVADEADVTKLPRSLAFSQAPEELVDAYIAATAAVAPAPTGAAGMTWVYTAMHGVGLETFTKVLEAAGYPQPTLVEAQAQPDATFPTVSFPNPEEPGAMDLAFETASDVGAELVIANDPDADRLAVAVPDPDAEGGWRRLTGNQIGLLLGWHAARTAAEAGPVEGASLACSLVSSPGLEVIARHYGLDFYATLTGFKWISRAPGIVFGFEEALGYLVNPDTVRDKDGISAAVAMLGLASEARGRGRSIGDLLDELEATFGAFASDQISIRVEELDTIRRMMKKLRKKPLESIGDVPVQHADDLRDGVDGLPPGDVLRYWLTDGSRVIVRPSGTEPKLKAYLDVRADTADEARARLEALVAETRELLARVG
ncbi:phospho-sugar mutase [Microbacter sp. GSS18]|nr:phospho-sugar mutase [Microbacter sp. GSS18]